MAEAGVAVPLHSYAVLVGVDAESDDTVLRANGELVAHQPLTVIWKQCNALGVLVPGFGTPEEVARVDVVGKVAIVQRGKIPMMSKALNVLDREAAALLIYDNAVGDTDLSEVYMDEVALRMLPVAVIRDVDGPNLEGKELLMKPSKTGASIWESLVDLRHKALFWRDEIFRLGIHTMLPIPVVFLVAIAGLADYVTMLLPLMAVYGLWAQRHFCQEVALWAAGKPFENLEAASRAMFEPVSICWLQLFCIPVWLWEFANTILEFVDPMLDGIQVGRSFSLPPESKAIFKESWSPVCTAHGHFWLVCPSFWGLPWTMTLVMLLNQTFPLWYVRMMSLRVVAERRDLAQLASLKPSELAKVLAPDRHLRFAGLAGLAEAGNLPLVGFMFSKLSDVESQLAGSDAAIRNTVLFVCRVMFEAAPMLWLQITLLGLSWNSSTKFSRAVNVASIVLSFKTVVIVTLGTLWEGLSGRAGKVLADGVRNWLVYRRHASADRAENAVRILKIGAMLGVICCGGAALCGAVASAIRLWGTFACESHIFNISEMRAGSLAAGCFKYSSRTDHAMI